MSFQLKNEIFLPARLLRCIPGTRQGIPGEEINSKRISKIYILFLQKITPDASDFKDNG